MRDASELTKVCCKGWPIRDQAKCAFLLRIFLGSYLPSGPLATPCIYWFPMLPSVLSQLACALIYATEMPICAPYHRKLHTRTVKEIIDTAKSCGVAHKVFAIRKIKEVNIKLPGFSNYFSLCTQSSATISTFWTRLVLLGAACDISGGGWVARERMRVFRTY